MKGPVEPTLGGGRIQDIDIQKGLEKLHRGPHCLHQGAKQTTKPLALSCFCQLLHKVLIFTKIDFSYGYLFSNEFTLKIVLS